MAHNVHDVDDVSRDELILHVFKELTEYIHHGKIHGDLSCASRFMRHFRIWLLGVVGQLQTLWTGGRRREAGE